MPNFRGKYKIFFIKMFIIINYLIVIELILYFIALGLKVGQFRRIIKTTAYVWHSMGKSLASGEILIAHLRKYKEFEEPYDVSYIPGEDNPILWWNTIEVEPNYLHELALKMLAIIPNSASCERNFSLLSWLTNNKRLQLDVQNLESIAKMCCFFNANAKKELAYFSAKMTEAQVLQVLHEANGQILEEEIINQEELIQPIDRPSSNTRSAITLSSEKLFLESSFNLNQNIFNTNLEYIFDDEDDVDSLIDDNSKDDESENINNDIGNFDWDPNDLVNKNDLNEDNLINEDDLNEDNLVNEDVLNEDNLVNEDD